MSELGDVFDRISKDPSHFFLQQNIKGCFRRPKNPLEKSTANITETTEEIPSAIGIAPGEPEQAKKEDMKLKAPL
jgi:hypothetical protein